ncbi:hypothetical protein BH10PSE11_BH10PSE11_33270 [soil metagenome]
MSRLIFVSFFVLLSACQTLEVATVPVGSNVHVADNQLAIPSDYRQQIAAHIKRSNGPKVSIKDAQISNPTVSWGGLIAGGRVVSVCVGLKRGAQPLFGSYRYTDQEYYLFAFTDGKLFWDTGNIIRGVAYQRMYCGEDRTFTPFPEAENPV